MTAAAIGLAVLLQAPVTITYEHVHADVIEIDVYEWKERGAPEHLSVIQQREGDAVVLSTAGGAMVVALFKRRDGAYLLDGPFAWPSQNARRTVDPTWRRTDRGVVPPDAGGSNEIEWLHADRLDGPWPRCFIGEQEWECWGVQPGNRGVIVLTAERLWQVIAAPLSSGPLRSAVWGRMVTVTESGLPSGALTVSFARPVAPPAERLAGFRLDTTAVAGARATVVGADTAWVCGEDVPPKAWMEIRTRRSGPVFVPLQDVASGRWSVPVQVRLSEGRTLSGRVSGPGNRPAPGTLITIFRAIELPPPDGRTKPRRVFAAESVADADGAFEVPGLGEAEYELLAFHSQLGRASVLLEAGQTDVDVRLAATGVIRGRVVANGRPLAGVDVISVPDAATFNAVRDITDAKGGDAKTDADGRFIVTAAAAGGGELRIGGGAYAGKRIPLPRPPLPSLDVGDIELGAPIEITVHLDRDPGPGCVLQAIGPVGRTGLHMIAGVRAGERLFRIALPEPGSWQFSFDCGGTRLGVSPPAVQIQSGNKREVQFVVR